MDLFTPSTSVDNEKATRENNRADRHVGIQLSNGRSKVYSLSEFTQYESELEHIKENIILNIVNPSRSFTYTKNSRGEIIDNEPISYEQTLGLEAYQHSKERFSFLNYDNLLSIYENTAQLHKLEANIFN